MEREAPAASVCRRRKEGKSGKKCGNGWWGRWESLSKWGTAMGTARFNIVRKGSNIEMLMTETHQQSFYGQSHQWLVLVRKGGRAKASRDEGTASGDGKMCS